jgi:hypothetical protein
MVEQLSALFKIRKQLQCNLTSCMQYLLLGVFVCAHTCVYVDNVGVCVCSCVHADICLCVITEGVYQVQR